MQLLENAIIVLKETEKQAQRFNGLIQTVNTDRGSQFCPNKRDKNGRAESVYQNYLKSRGIKRETKDEEWINEDMEKSMEKSEKIIGYYTDKKSICLIRKS